MIIFIKLFSGVRKNIASLKSAQLRDAWQSLMVIHHPEVGESERKKFCKRAMIVSKNYIEEPMGQKKLTFTKKGGESA